MKQIKYLLAVVLILATALPLSAQIDTIPGVGSQPQSHSSSIVADDIMVSSLAGNALSSGTTHLNTMSR